MFARMAKVLGVVILGITLVLLIANIASAYIEMKEAQTGLAQSENQRRIQIQKAINVLEEKGLGVDFSVPRGNI